MKNENEIKIGKETLIVKPVKMKYIKNNFYSNYLILKEYGLIKVFKFSDGEEVVVNFLTAIFDDEELAKRILEDLDNKIMNEMISTTKKLNEIEDEPKNPNETTPQD